MRMSFCATVCSPELSNSSAIPTDLLIQRVAPAATVREKYDKFFDDPEAASNISADDIEGMSQGCVDISGMETMTSGMRRADLCLSPPTCSLIAMEAGLASASGPATQASFYEVLCVDRKASSDEIDGAYRQAVSLSTLLGSVGIKLTFVSLDKAAALRDMRKTAWTPELRAQAAANLATIKQAYAVLKDSKPFHAVFRTLTSLSLDNRV